MDYSGILDSIYNSLLTTQTFISDLLDLVHMTVVPLLIINIFINFLRFIRGK